MSDTLIRRIRWWRFAWRTRATRWYIPWAFLHWLERRGYCWFSLVMWRQFGGESWRWWEDIPWQSSCATRTPENAATCYCGIWDHRSEGQEQPPK